MTELDKLDKEQLKSLYKLFKWYNALPKGTRKEVLHQLKEKIKQVSEVSESDFI